MKLTNEFETLLATCPHCGAIKIETSLGIHWEFSLMEVPQVPMEVCPRHLEPHPLVRLRDEELTEEEEAGLLRVLKEREADYESNPLHNLP